MLVPDRPTWWDKALCLGGGPKTFYPEKGGGAYETAKSAKDICNGVYGPVCPVRFECLEDALVNRERFGVWGGLSERERSRLRTRLLGNNLNGNEAVTPKEAKRLVTALCSSEEIRLQATG